jgi:transcriptional regulator with XRE-family HTH domain/predicted DNA-binding transcriptional regulator AlpA
VSSSSHRSGANRRTRRPVADRELEEALRRSLDLSLAERLRLFEQLRADLGGDLGVETEADRQIRLRAEALAALRQAATLLGTAEGEAPTIADYNRAAAAHGLGLTSAQIREAFGRWETAKAALVGEPIPPTPFQRAVRRAIGGPREFETYIEAVRLWLASAPISEQPKDYDDWLAQENDRRVPSGLLPLPSYQTLRRATMASWTDILLVARGQKTLVQAQNENLGFDLRSAGPGALIVTNGVAQLLGVTNDGLKNLERRELFPQPITRVGLHKLWLLSDVLAYRDDREFPARERFQMMDAYLSLEQVAETIGRSQNTVRNSAWRQNWRQVPPTVAVVGRVLVWDRAVVEDWLTNRLAPGEREWDPAAEDRSALTADPQVIGYRMRQIRRARGLTQVELAERARMRQSQISKIESTATAAPSLGTVVQLANALGCAVDALLSAGAGDEGLDEVVAKSADGPAALEAETTGPDGARLHGSDARTEQLIRAAEIDPSDT